MRDIVSAAMAWGRSWDDTEPLEDHDEAAEWFVSSYKVNYHKTTSYVEVSDQLVDQMNGEWSRPVEFRFERLNPNQLEMHFRTCAETRP